MTVGESGGTYECGKRLLTNDRFEGKVRDYLCPSQEAIEHFNHIPYTHNWIFVFGSNLAGRHGKGAALCALKYHGAIYGQGVGLQGKSYAIPTKDERLKTLPLEVIAEYVEEFKAFAASHPELTFQVTAIGCGLAGYTPANIAPMFMRASSNCMLPDKFVVYLKGLTSDSRALGEL